ncbi:MAG: hypothetical protein NW203_07550 [Hyphomonadaceae bacterium]|nr:hypothetical protein [Hyphomonadaceae bacterium]
MATAAGAARSASPFERAFAALMARAEAGDADAARQAGAIAIDRDPARARAAFARAAALDPLDAGARLALARLHLEGHALDEARAMAADAFACAVDEALRALAAFALGEIAAARGDAGEARDAYGAAQAMQRAILQSHPEDVEARRHAARAAQRLADLEEAPQAREDAHAAALAALEALPMDQCGPGALEDAAFGCARLAALAQARRDYDAARRYLARQRAALTRLAALEPDEPAWRGELAEAHRAEIRFAADAGEPGPARAAAEQAVQLLLGLAAADPTSGDRALALAAGWSDLTECCAAAGDDVAARNAAAQAGALLARVGPAAPGAPAIALERARLDLTEAALAFRAKALEPARKAAAAACTALDALAAQGAPAATPLLARAWALLGEIAMAARRADQAADAFARAAAFDARCGGAQTTTLNAALAQACEAAGDLPAARRAQSAVCDALLCAVQAAPQRRDLVDSLARALDKLAGIAAFQGDSRAAAAAWRDGAAISETLLTEGGDDDVAALRLCAQLTARLGLARNAGAVSRRARALTLLERIARLGGMTAEDVSLQAALLEAR